MAASVQSPASAGAGIGSTRTYAPVAGTGYDLVGRLTTDDGPVDVVYFSFDQMKRRMLVGIVEGKLLLPVNARPGTEKGLEKLMGTEAPPIKINAAIPSDIFKKFQELYGTGYDISLHPRTTLAKQ